MKFTINRTLRKNQTIYEKKLWFLLRSRKLKGYKFRRQFKIGNYVADFCCVEKKLVIELDGIQHSYPEEKIKDEAKAKYLNSQGYRVKRFWNSELEENSDEVLDKIIKAVNSDSLADFGEGRGEVAKIESRKNK